MTSGSGRKGMWLAAVACLLAPAAPGAAQELALAEDSAWMETVTANPVVGTMLGQVQEAALTSCVGQLSGAEPAIVGGTAQTIASRHTTVSGGEIDLATQYVYEHLQAMGLTPSYHSWSNCGISNRNVVADKPGATVPGEIVVLVAHLDSMPRSTVSPGADDNATGSAAVLAAAEVLGRYGFQRTLRFLLVTGEEQGLCGSDEYAAEAYARGDDIVGVYNMDMLGWNSDSSPTLRLHTRTSSNPGYAADLALAETFTGVVSAYGMGGALSPIVTADGETASDHSCFWDRGYPGLLAIEDDYSDFNPNYHSIQDLLSRIDTEYFTYFTRAVLGSVAHQAHPIGGRRPADFDGSGKSDLLWRKAATGENAVWVMSGATVAQGAALPALPAAWAVAGQGDLDGDGRADVLWRNADTGAAAVWFLNGTSLASAAYTTAVAAPWTVAGVADFDANGKDDVLWRNPTTGQNAVWLMNGAAVATAAVLPTVTGAWEVAGVGDLDATGKADVLWRDAASGTNAVWFMNDATVASAGYLPGVASPWAVAGVADLDGNSRADVLWRRADTGENAAWLVNGAAVVSASTLPPVAAPWAVAGVGDFDGTGKADVLWRNADTGANALWFMSGLTVASAGYPPAVPDAGWTVAAP